MRLHAAADERADRTGRDNRAARALRFHLLRRGLRDVERAVQIHRDGGLEYFRRHVEKRMERADARVTREHVHLAECLHGFAHQLLPCLARGDIAFNSDHAPPERLDFLDHFGDGDGVRTTRRYRPSS